MTPMRLAIVARRFWPCAGSMETRAVQLACGLADCGAEVTLLTARWQPSWPADVVYHGLPIVRLDPPPLGRWTTWRWKRSLSNWLRRHVDDLDLVYVYGLGDEAQVAVEAMGRGVPVVLVPARTGWQGDCFRQVEIAGGQGIKNACMKAAAFVALDLAARRELEAAGYPRTRIHDLTPGVVELPIRTSETVVAARALLVDANAALQLPPQAPLIVSTGRLEAGRGIEHLLEAWSIVAPQFATARLWFAGEGAARAEVLQRIDAMQLTSRAGWIGNFDAIEGLLTAADILVAPGPDGSPQAILEAMAAGIPSVAIDVPVNRWLLGDDAAGLLVPPDDPVAFAAALHRLLGDADLAARLGLAGRQRVQRDFLIAKMIREHLDLFARLTYSSRSAR